MEIDEYYKDIDRVFRLPRVWSNRELLKFAKLFDGDVANISGWTDVDKEGAHYKDYFSHAASYTITNYKEEARGFQGSKNELYLDLTAELPKELINKFDVVFNHTVLEHIYEVNLAVKNLCSMTKDIAIVVVPFLQEMHADYGDYWRFTPLAMKNLFNENDMKMIYCTFNSHPNASVYLFCIATKNESKWVNKIPSQTSHIDPFPGGKHQNWVGCHAINSNSKKTLFSRFFDKLF